MDLKRNCNPHSYAYPIKPYVDIFDEKSQEKIDTCKIKYQIIF